MVESPESASSTADDWREFEPLDLHPVLQAALEAFDTVGYNGATVRAIASRLGVTVPTIYYHFKDKQSLLSSLLLASADETLHRCRRALSDSEDTSEARLSSMVEAIVLYMIHRPLLSRLDSEMRHLESEQRRTYVARRDALQVLLRDVIEAGCEEGSFVTPYPAEATRAIFAMCHGVATWYQPDGPLSPDEIAHRYVRLALSLVGATRDRFVSELA